MKQRVLALLLTLAMLVSMSTATISALASTNPTITLEKKEAYVGDDISIVVSIENNPGIWGMDLRISYDKTVMTLTSVENGDFYQNSEWTAGNLNADVYILSYEASGFDDITTASGTLATLNFKIKDNAATGTYNVSATYNPGDIINVSFDDINFDISNGSITVKNRPVPVTGLALDKSTASVETGDGTLTLTPIFTPETATNKNVKWESSDDSIATVANGIVTLIKKGVVTITATTEDGNYSASCVVTINCSHRMGHDVPAEDSTCIKHGHGAYTVCDECGEIIEGSDAELPLGDHVGGTANCQHKAVCTVCGEEYGELGDHNYTEIADKQCLKSVATCGSKAVYYKSCSVCGAKGTETFEAGEYDYTNHVGETYKKNQKEATCFEEGYTGDTYCRTCDREISKGESIPKNAHNPASVWTTDETYHWKECQTVGCGNLIDKAPHSGGEATCTKKAVCSVCGIEYGEVDSNNHKHTEVRDAKDATCCEAGYTGDTWCTDCNTKIENGTVIPATGKHVDVDGKWETDGTNHWHTCYFGTKFDVTSHNGGVATCKDKAVCSVCGVEYGEKNSNNHAGKTTVLDSKVATCCEAGYTGDTWCTDCNTKIANGTVIPATGNHVDVDGRWESDGTNHYHTCYFGTKFDFTAHSGGEATCKDKAVCSVCGTAYGEVNASNHKGTTYIKDQKEATCYKEGYTGDTYCSDCDVKIKDGTVIEKSAHNPASVWTTDATHHWKVCEVIGCGNLIDKAEHSGGEATCVTKAVCSVCGVQYGEVNANNHKHTEVRDAKVATCCEAGYTGDTWCTDCNTKIASGTVIPATGKHVDVDGKWESDGTNHYHTCYFGTKFDITGHSGGEATCKDKAVCSICGTAYGELNSSNHKGNTYLKDQKEATCYEEGYTGDTYCSDCDVKIKDGTVVAKTAHNPASVWTTNETHHWKVCEVIGCGNLIDKAPHTGGEATCTTQAICSVCGVKYGEKNPANHTGGTEIKDALEAKCNTDGYTGDTYCKGCGVKISDGKATAKIPHVVTEWTVTKEATTESTGTKSGKCKGCGETITVTTAKLVSEVKKDNIEGIDATIEGVGETNLSEDVIFEVNNVTETITAPEKTKIENSIKALTEFANKKIGAIFDLGLILRETADNGDVIAETKLVLTGTVKVTIPVPTALTENLTNLKLLHIQDEGTVKEVPFTLADGKATFETDGFSYYTFVGTEKATNEGTNNQTPSDNETDKSPATGDNSNVILWSVVAVISLAAFSVTGLIFKKKRVR